MNMQYTNSNLDNEDFLRLNDIDNPVLLDWYDNTKKLEELTTELSSIDFPHENELDDFYNALVIRDMIDADVQKQFDDLKSRMQYMREAFEDRILSKLGDY